MKDRFQSCNQIKLKLMESFPSYVPSSTDFEIGYIKGRANIKCWIVSCDDIDAMYDAYNEGDEIALWCDAKSTCSKPTRKRKVDDDDADTPRTKRTQRVDEQQKIFEELKKKHTDGQFSDPKLRLWAKLIQSGMHEDHDKPPNIPIFTGVSKSGAKAKQSKDDTDGSIRYSCKCNCYSIEITSWIRKCHSP